MNIFKRQRLLESGFMRIQQKSFLVCKRLHGLVRALFRGHDLQIHSSKADLISQFGSFRKHIDHPLHIIAPTPNQFSCKERLT
jgi:hypothetical protein